MQSRSFKNVPAGQNLFFVKGSLSLVFTVISGILFVAFVMAFGQLGRMMLLPTLCLVGCVIFAALAIASHLSHRHPDAYRVKDNRMEVISAGGAGRIVTALAVCALCFIIGVLAASNFNGNLSLSNTEAGGKTPLPSIKIGGKVFSSNGETYSSNGNCVSNQCAKDVYEASKIKHEQFVKAERIKHERRVQVLAERKEADKVANAEAIRKHEQRVAALAGR